MQHAARVVDEDVAEAGECRTEGRRAHRRERHRDEPLLGTSDTRRGRGTRHVTGHGRVGLRHGAAASTGSRTATTPRHVGRQRRTQPRASTGFRGGTQAQLLQTAEEVRHVNVVDAVAPQPRLAHGHEREARELLRAPVRDVQLEVQAARHARTQAREPHADVRGSPRRDVDRVEERVAGGVRQVAARARLAERRHSREFLRAAQHVAQQHEARRDTSGGGGGSGVTDDATRAAARQLLATIDSRGRCCLAWRVRRCRRCCRLPRQPLYEIDEVAVHTDTQAGRRHAAEVSWSSGHGGHDDVATESSLRGSTRHTATRVMSRQIARTSRQQGDKTALLQQGRAAPHRTHRQT